MRLARRTDHPPPALVAVVNAALPATSPLEQNFADFYRRAVPIGVRHAQWFLDTPDAWDAVQDASSELFRKWKDLRPEQKSIAFFVAAVHKRILTRQKRAMREQRRFADVDVGEIEDEYEEKVDLFDDLSVVVGNKLMTAVEFVRSEVKNLSPRLREVVVFTMEHGMTYAEIAETLGIAEVTVRRHMSLAHAALREARAKAEGRLLPDTPIKGTLPGQTSGEVAND